MSSACLRKLNRDRELETRNKLMHSYKSLLKIGINLNSRTTLASLLYEAERKLKELLKVKHSLVLVFDHDEQMFVKLN